MIDLHYWTTPNGHKITIFLEEAKLPYRIKTVNISASEQFTAEFLKISPNNKIPAIVDHAPLDGGKPLAIFESGAILLYLADKTRQFIPQDLHGRYQTLQWLFWQVSGLGPVAGQNHYFSLYSEEKIPAAIERFVTETTRLYGVLNKQLEEYEFITGEFSIADMACYPWVALYERQSQHLDDFPHIARWLQQVRARPAVQQAYELAANINPDSTLSAGAKQMLFGQAAYEACEIKRK